MGSPYLNSGETIVLTTNRVITGDVSYDVMLTTERIFFIDNRNPRFEPGIILLSSILSVQGGKTPANEPVITILFHPDEDGTRTPLNLLFSQNATENRKPERDDWIRALIRVSIALQEKKLMPDTPPGPEAAGNGGLQPTVRHWIAPERVLPRSDVVRAPVVPAPVVITPEEVDGGGEIVVRAPVTPSTNEEISAPEPVPEPIPYTAARAAPAPKTKVIIPQITEELLPSRMNAAPPVADVPADPNPLSQSIQNVIQSLRVSGEPVSEPARGVETGTDLPEPSEVPFPAVRDPVPDAELGTGPESVLPVPSLEVQSVDEPGPAEVIVVQPGPPAITPETPEGSGYDHDTTGTVSMREDGPVPESREPGENSGQDAVSIATTEIPPSEGTGIIKTPVIAVTEPAEQEPSALPSVPESVARPEPVAPASPPSGHPLPPGQTPYSRGTILWYAVVLVLVIALAAAGVMLSLPQEPGPAGNPSTPAGTVPETQSPAIQQTTAATPAATRVPISPVTSPQAPAIPPDGIWVEVNSTVYYFGKAGNPEQMQQVSGTGVRFFRVPRSDQPVQVSVQKQDNSGAPLTVVIYRNGTLITTRTVTMPMGTVYLLIDTVTGRAPGLTENDTASGHAGNPVGRVENY